MTDTTKKLAYLSAAIILFKILCAFLFPLTGDEAYFISWGKSFDAGYYDHPPLTGWVVFWLSHISSSHVFLRLFMIACGVLAAWLIYLCAKEDYPEKASTAAFLFLLSPVHLALILYSNDIMLFVFTLIAALLYMLAMKRNSLLLSVAGGLVFGLAFMSKYLSFPMLVGLFFYTVFSKDRRRFLHFTIFSLMIVPFFVQNMYYNYTHCWNNIMFNIINRTAGTKNIFTSLGSLFGNILYVFTPWLLYFLYKERKNIRIKSMSFMMLAVPIVFFILLSARRKIDMHWLLPAVPFFFVLTASISAERLRKALKYTAVFTLLHVIAVSIFLAIPISVFKDKQPYPTLVAFSDTKAVCKEMDAYKDSTQATQSYVLSALLDIKCGRDVHVMFATSKHGRQDDSRIDLRTLEGKDIAMLYRRPVEKKQFRKFFDTVEIKSFTVNEATFYVMHGKGFNYEYYRKKYLKPIYKQFYSFPSWLQPKSCLFCEYYFPDGLN